MRSARTWVALGSAGLAMTAATAAMGTSAATAAGGQHHHSNAHAVAAKRDHAVAHKTTSSALARSKPRGNVAGSSRVHFDLVLSLRHPAKASAFVRKVSTPGSATYRHYLSDRQWQARFGPSAAQVRTARKWLHNHGFTRGTLPRTRLLLATTGSAARIEKAFHTSLGMYRVNGHTVRLAKNSIELPHALAGAVTGVTGVNQYVATPALSRSSAAAVVKAPADAEPPPPAGFRNPQPCSAYWGQKVDTADSPSLYKPYAGKRPYDICGYTPSQLRSAYGIQKQVASGLNGKGVKIAIVDAYDSPTLLSDAQKYFSLNDPGNPLKSSQFLDVNPGSVNQVSKCNASSWYDEQALDVEATHTMAPGATLIYEGATNCNDAMLTSLQKAITSGASVVSDSWGDVLGDLLDDQDTKLAFDNTFSMAVATGVSVLFSSGDDGDNFADFGIDAPDYPPSSPLVTAVGGTSLKVGPNGARENEPGWSTGRQVLCSGVATTSCGSSSTTGSPMAFNAGSGGGTSYTYLEPPYQKGIVPKALGLRNEALLGTDPGRVEPDISMDADAQTGMLIGLTQTFPNKVVQYDQFKEGGTSLASPLLAGVVADTDQAAGTSLGFLNPALYAAEKSAPGSILDVVPPPVPADAATVRVDYANTTDVSEGYIVSLRVLDYQGPEVYCDGTNNCATRPVTLTTTKGYDSMTGLGTVGAGFIADLAKF